MSDYQGLIFTLNSNRSFFFTNTTFLRQVQSEFLSLYGQCLLVIFFSDSGTTGFYPIRNQRLHLEVITLILRPYVHRITFQIVSLGNSSPYPDEKTEVSGSDREDVVNDKNFVCAKELIRGTSFALCRQLPSTMSEIQSNGTQSQGRRCIEDPMEPVLN